MAAAVKSEDCIGTWSAPKSLFTYNMLQIGHLPSLQIVGTILIHLGCPIGTVNSLPSPFHACGSWTATTAKSWSRVSFIRLSCTVSCFLIFNWMTWNILLMPSRVEFRAAATKRLVRSTTGYTLGYLRLALTMMVVFGSAPRIYPILATQESLVAKLLAVVALYWSSSPLKHPSICRFTCYKEVAFL